MKEFGAVRIFLAIYEKQKQNEKSFGVEAVFKTIQKLFSNLSNFKKYSLCKIHAVLCSKLADVHDVRT